MDLPKDFKPIAPDAFSHFGSRLLCFVACIPSGGALLAKLYGLTSMPYAVLGLALPGCVVLVFFWQWARRTGRDALADALVIGFVGGLLGTLAYDLIRVPFLLQGRRIFAPISAYGIWIADATQSSRFTDLIGWTYHFSNGLAFGIMYALFLRGRHWGWAVVWAFILETIAILSPFAQIFSLSGDYYNIGIAYLGHVAYGVPLGLLVQRWDATRTRLANAPPWVPWLAALGAAAGLLGPTISPPRAERDARATDGTFRIEGHRLNPNWLRIERGDGIAVVNPNAEAAQVHLRPLNTTTQIDGNQQTTFTFPETGVYQIFVMTDQRSHSSFIIVEPVEDLP